VFGFYIALFGFDAETAMLFAFAFSFVAHAGDLFESLVKRRFGVKNSGGLIPAMAEYWIAWTRCLPPVW